MTTRNKIVTASEFRLKGRGERFVGQDGHINAGSKSELIQALTAALNEMSEGTRVITASKAAQLAEVAAAHKESLTAAFQDDARHKELGNIIAAELTISANKEGFARNLLKRQELAQGQRPQAQVQMKNVTAVLASGPVMTETQYVRDNYLFPAEFYITARPYIEQRDINTSSTDILEQKYLEAMEALMVTEDRVWRNLAQQSVGVANEPISIVGQLTPTGLATIRNLVTRWRVPASNILVASDLWIDILGEPAFAQTLDPVSKHELFLTGKLGTMLGMGVYTDAYRHSTHQILDKGEIWVVGEANSHGQYTDRGGVTSQPIDGTTENVPGRGWFMSEEMSMVIANSKSVGYGRRV